MGVGESQNLNTYGDCKGFSPDTEPIPYHLKLNYPVAPPMPPPPTPTGILVMINKENLYNLNTINECDPVNHRWNNDQSIYYHVTLDYPEEK